MNDNRQNNNIIPFFILTYIISWALWTPSILNSKGVAVPGIFLLIAQFALLGPSVAAIILLGKSNGKLGIKSLFRSAWNWKFNKLWLIPTLLLPAAMIGVTLLIRPLFDATPFQMGEPFAPLPIFIILMFFMGGPLEEFGWRGYAQPRLLQRHSFIISSLILGFMHGLWHLPLHFMEGTVQSAMPLWEFIAVTTVGAFIYAWIYKRTNGNLMLMLLHHWAGNLSAALLVYWQTSAGRWIFFIVQLVVVLLILILDKKHLCNQNEDVKSPVVAN